MENGRRDEEFVLVDAAPRGTISAQKFQPIKGSKRTALLASAIGAIALYGLSVLIGGGGSSGAFAPISVGSYVGQLTGVVAQPVSLYVERTAEGGALFILPLKANWESGLAAAPQPDAPLKLLTPEGTIVLSGSTATPQGYSGLARNVDSKSKGEWQLRLLDGSAVFGLSDEERGSLDAWMRIRREVLKVDKQIDQAVAQMSSDKQEIEKLNTFLSDEGLLKSRADKSFEDTKAQLQQVRETLSKKQKEAAQLSEQLKISERVTNAGKLVSLARESLEREGRWQESMMKTEVGSPEFLRELERAEKISGLKREINEAREKLLALQGRQPIPAGSASPWDSY